MVKTKYPEWVEKRLFVIDKEIVRIYKEESLENITSVTYEDVQYAKMRIYERTKPFIDEKVKLITDSVPTYIVTLDNHEHIGK